MSRAALGWGAIVVCLFITVLASSPWWPNVGGVIGALPGQDKTGHFVIMGLLAGACVLAFAGRSVRGWRLTPARLLLLVSVAVTVDEFVQAFVPSRSFDLVDLAASLGGIAVIGGLAAVIVSRGQPAPSR